MKTTVTHQKHAEYYANRKKLPSFKLYSQIYQRKAYINKRNVLLATHAANWKAARIELLTFLGGFCRTCSYSADWRALQIDHVNGDGFEDPNRRLKPDVMLKFLKEHPEQMGRYQLLCANCNIIKRSTNGEFRTRKPLQELEAGLQTIISQHEAGNIIPPR
jgi:hypothetical protein